MKLRYRMLVSAAISLAAARGQELTLEETLRKAVMRTRERELLRVAAARGTEQYLEAQSRFRLDLQPGLGLLAFSNPAIAATRMGAGLMLGRSNAPSQWMRQDARLNTLAAEIGAEQAIVRTEMETVQRFFELLDRQRSLEELGEAVARRRTAMKVVDERVKNQQATAADRAGWHISLVDLEIQLAEYESEHEAAVLRLAELIATPGEQVRVKHADSQPESVRVIPAAQDLYQLAFQHRRDAQAVRTRLEAEKRNLPKDKRVRANGVSAGFAQVSDEAGASLGLAKTGALLGGNTGSLDVGVTISLRDNGAGKAMASAFNARIRGLEMELDAIESSIRLQVDWLRALAISSRRRAELARRKLELSEQVWKTAVARESTGLTTPEAVLSAEADLLRARTTARQLESERETRWHHLASACGIGDRPLMVQTKLMAAR